MALQNGFKVFLEKKQLRFSNILFAFLQNIRNLPTNGGDEAVGEIKSGYKENEGRMPSKTCNFREEK